MSTSIWADVLRQRDECSLAHKRKAVEKLRSDPSFAPWITDREAAIATLEKQAAELVAQLSR